MPRQRAVMVLAGAAAVWRAVPLVVSAVPAARAVTQAGTWGTAIEVPGLGPLNQGGRAQLNSVSCGAAGNCVAVGSYTDGAGHAQAFVVSQTNGKWRRAIEVPGLGALNPVGPASADSVSYPSAGNCAVGGTYTDRAGHTQAFVVNKTKRGFAPAQRDMFELDLRTKLDSFFTSLDGQASFTSLDGQAS